MKSRVQKAWIDIEDLIIYSPFFVVFLIIFNVPDSKYFASRLILISALYCAVRFYPLWKTEFREKRTIIISAFLFCCYFYLMQLFNEGNSDFPRAILHSLIYFIFLPLERFRRNWFFYLLTMSSVSIGIGSFYQVYFLGVERAGLFSINPIPYSYFSGICMIFLSYIFIRKENKNLSTWLMFFFGFFLAFSSIILTQTRATLLAMLVVFIFSTLYSVIKSPSKIKFFSILIGYILLPLALWNIPMVEQRISDAVEQIHNYEHDDYSSSSGVRIKLWESGLDIASEHIIFGTDRSLVRSISSEKIANKKYPDYLSEFLIHPNANFHNQYIQALVDSGMFGLVFILIFIACPFFCVMKYKNYHTKLFGMSLVIFTGVCLWFDSLFLYNHTVILYSLIIISLFWIRFDEKESL
ncbi:O-antigen ligase family protein [Vibrio mimicus]